MHGDTVIYNAQPFVVDFEAIEAGHALPQHRNSTVFIGANPLAECQLWSALEAPSIALIELDANWGILNAVAALQFVALEADLTQSVNASLPAELLIIVSAAHFYPYFHIDVIL